MSASEKFAAYGVIFKNFEEKLSAALDQKNLSDVLNLIFLAANKAKSSRQCHGEKLWMPELDRLVESLSTTPLFSRYHQEDAQQESKVQTLVLATEIYPVGGHGKLLQLLSEELAPAVVFTNIFRKWRENSLPEDVKYLVRSEKYRVLPPQISIFQRLIALIRVIYAIKPRRLILLVHHEDVVAILASKIYFAGERTIFIHHCDYNPALGATIRFQKHIDMTQGVQEICSGALGATIQLPMPVEETGFTVHPGGGALNIATSGSYNKFNGSAGGLSYGDLIAEILSVGLIANFYHIGTLSDESRRDIKNVARRVEGNGSKFIEIGPVTCVSRKLVELNCQAYFQSFPLGGGFAASEAQSVGCPVIFANSSYSPRLCRNPSLYADKQLEWTLIGDLKEIFNLLIKDWHKFHKSALLFYQSNHSRARFSERLSEILELGV